MKIIRTTPDSNGAYPAIQNWPGRAIPDGYAQWPDSLPTAVFEQYNDSYPDHPAPPCDGV